MEVAIVCSSFNRAKQLERTVWSIANQDYPLDKVVLIIIDDGSVDNTPTTIAQLFDNYPNLNLIDIVTQRKKENHFGGHGIVLNLGLRYAEELGAEYVFLTGGDILWSSYALRKHLLAHKDLDEKIRVVAVNLSELGEFKSQLTGYKENNMESIVNAVSATIHNSDADLLLGPRIYFIRPDRESLGEAEAAPGLLANIPDWYDWKPPEKLLSHPTALTLEEFPDRDHIYLGYPGERPCDNSHPESPSLQSAKLSFWLRLGGWDESGIGHFYEDLQLRLRLLNYLNCSDMSPIFPIVHPEVSCFHQPHPRQLSSCNHDIFVENVEKYGYNVNKGQNIDWGRCPHRIRKVRVRN